MTRPLRRITLHFSQIFLTLGLTFTSFQSVLCVHWGANTGFPQPYRLGKFARGTAPEAYL